MATHYVGTDEERRALDAFIKLRRAANTVGARANARTRLAKLTESQFGVLEALLYRGPMCQTDLAVKLLRSTGNLTTVIDNLERDGLVERRRGAGTDRRMVTVVLTDTGRRLIEEIFPGHVAAIVADLSVLTPDEQVELGRLCRKLGLHAAGETRLGD